MNILGCFFKKTENELDKMKLFKLQSMVVDKLNKFNYAMVFDEVGAGKSIAGIHAILDILSKKKKDEITNILIIAPNEHLAKKWQSEIKKFTGLTFKIAHNTFESYVRYESNKSNLFITYNGSNYGDLGINKLSNTFFQEFNFNTLTYEELKKLEGDVYLNSFEEFILFYDIEKIFKKMEKCDIKISKRQLGDFLKKYSYIKKMNKDIDMESYRAECYKPSNWDLMIIDEAHYIYENYYKQLFGEIAYVDNNKGYYKVNGLHKADKLLIITATPKSFKKLNNIVKKVLNNNTEIKEDINISAFLTLSNDIPVQRYFKEAVIGENYTRIRNVELIEYAVSELMRKINNNDIRNKSHYRNQGNIKLILDKLECNDVLLKEIYTIDEIRAIGNAKNIYEKDIIEDCDYQFLNGLDNKLIQFVEYLKKIEYVRNIVFVQNIETRNLIEKVNKSLGVKVFILSAEDKKNRLNTIENFNKFKGNKTLLSTWSIGNFGLNIPGADTVICYETPYGIDELEQGFGRIDRLDFGFNNIKLILFKNKDNGYHFDNIGINRLYDGLFMYQSNIPTKNILFTSNYLCIYLENIEKKSKVYKKINKIINNKTIFDNSNIVNVNYFIDILNENKIDYKQYYYELELYNTIINIESLKNKISEHNELTSNIDVFKEKSREAFNDKDIIDMLKKAIYYREDGQLKVTSIEEINKNLSAVDSIQFNKIINSLENIKNLKYNDIKEYVVNNCCKEYAEAVISKLT